MTHELENKQAEHRPAFSQRIDILERDGRYREALDHVNKSSADERRRWSYQQCHQYARLLQRSHEDEESIFWYNRALDLKPHNARTINNLAVILLNSGKSSEGLLLLESILNDSEKAEGLEQEEWILLNNTRVQLLLMQQRVAEACQISKKLVLREGNSRHLTNLAVSLRCAAKARPACRAQELALAKELNCPESVYKLRSGLDTVVRLEDKKLTCEQRTSARVQTLNLATMMLTINPLDAHGWRLLNARLNSRLTTEQGRILLAGLWQGQQRRSLCLWDEQGFGDTLMALRWLPQAVNNCRNAVVVLRRSLVRLVRERMKLPGNCTILCLEETSQPWQECEQHIPLMSLPGALFNDMISVGTTNSYLTRRGSQTTRKGVGIVWAAGAKDQADVERQRNSRSIPTEIMATWIGQWQKAGHEYLVNLQLGAERGEMGAQGIHIPGIESGGDWETTAAQVDDLKGVLTVDTAIAHLCGAMGVPCVMLVNVPCDWRWGEGGAGVKWYDSVQIVRCPQPNDWAAALAEGGQQLLRLLAGTHTQF